MNVKLFFFFMVLLGIGQSEEPAHLISEFTNCLSMDPHAFHSQVNQDKFVHSILYELLDKKDRGYYLEIGAGEPVYINNSYFFEKNLHWEGVSIDISKDLAERWYNERQNLLLCEDATQSDYSVILKNFPKIIDYLSLDVDGYYDQVLERVVQTGHVFKVITIEHDFYRYGDFYRQKERAILKALGYHLLCPDVSHNGYAFEDWWIHPDFFPPPLFSQLSSTDLRSKDYAEIIQTVKNLVLKQEKKVSF